MVTINEQEYISHYGTPRKSGRYPWGSGDNAKQDHKGFLDYIEDLKRRLGLSEKQIADDLGISTTKLRADKARAKNALKQEQINMAQRLKDKGYSTSAIAKRMEIPESTARTLLAPGAKDKADLLTSTANQLKAEVEKAQYLDVGKGVDARMGVSDTRLKTAISMLEDEGYKLHYVKVKQLGTGKETTVKVLTKDDVPYSEVSQNRDKITPPQAKSIDGGRSFPPDYPPMPISPDRVGIVYKEDGGDLADGVIYVRPGVDDISLGGSGYAQVRIQVGDGHYLKGMAVYKDDLPEGTDLLFNTNKSDTGNKFEAMKELTKDSEYPFGSVTRPLLKDQGTENERVASVMNIVHEEGDWSNWSQSVASQVLSKQSPKLAKEQLAMTYERRKQEYDEIMALTNPVVKKKLLQEFADGTDTAAVELKAAALSSRQGSHVLLPVPSMKETEVYAPGFRDGEPVVLIRYPHGGIFEIPELRVNNRQSEAKKLLANAKDAIGINAKVAEQLSGADFDGDTVLVIPNSQKKVDTAKPLRQLKDFDPRSSFPGYEGMKRMTPRQKGIEMGDVSNLITDMTIMGAPHSEIARAIKHSMVVIDAEKHGLDWKASARQNNIAQLKEKYQGRANAGAATLISRASSQTRVPDRIPRRASEGGPIDPATGKKMYTYTGKTYTDKQGRVKPSLSRSKKLYETDDAFTLSSGTPMEAVYAEHSNRLKSLANDARKAMLKTPRSEWSSSAKKTYADQVTSLDSKLRVARRNAPLERKAQLLANATVKATLDANPEMKFDNDAVKKLKARTLTTYRNRVGAGKQKIEITPTEWEAIQAGAISSTKLSSILDNADMDLVREYATPKPARLLMTPAKSRRAKSMLSSGATRAEVADALGVSLTTLDEADVL